MNNLEDREVIILGAHCEECGHEVIGAVIGPEDNPLGGWFPMRTPAGYLREEFHCRLCGGRVVFEMAGAPA